jgi:predicted nucleic acid-binding protein
LNVYFVDTSALAKRYLDEVGSNWILGWIEPPAGNIVVVSELANIEMFSMFARRQREGKLTSVSIASLRIDFLLHVEQEYLTVLLDSAIVRQAQTLLTTYSLRTLDAIQLACALQAVSTLGISMTFVSADNNLLAAAHAEGFVTDNPLDHPRKRPLM